MQRLAVSADVLSLDKLGGETFWSSSCHTFEGHYGIASCSLLATGSQLSSLRRGVTWLYLHMPQTMQQAKFCMLCNFVMLCLEALDHTVQQ